jgi:alkylation response protein AidB-like acyl-CoA dehydrogenase
MAHPDQAFPEIIQSLADKRMMGMSVPREYGGGGRDEVSHALALMEISGGSAAVGGVVAWNNALYCFPLLKYGTEEQKSKYLPPCATGEKTGSFALIGSAFSGSNRFIPVGSAGEGLVKGQGSFLPCGVSFGIAPVASQERNSPVFFIFDLERTPGLRRGHTLERGGIFFFGIAEAIFENASSRGLDLLGRGADGNILLQSVLQEAWMAVGAMAAGIGGGALEEVLDFVGRQQGHGFISQSMQWKLADMAVDVEAARLFVLKAAWLKDQGKTYEKEAASAKVFGAGAAVRAACESLEILGDKNPLCRASMEKRMRDAKMCRVYFGTSEEAGFVVADHAIGRARMTGF